MSNLAGIAFILVGLSIIGLGMINEKHNTRLSVLEAEIQMMKSGK